MMDLKVTTKTFLYLLVVLEILLLIPLSGGSKKEHAAIRKKCDACKLLTDNFKKGIEKTERFMYDGGDADWEEKKLGSYANSEMRFIEITETLCENKEHDCHNLLETKEELLEEWWKEHQQDEPDLYQWFCLENYKVCCPENMFGPDCLECPYGTERPCKGNGKCLGAGTRAGSGKCKCNAGYKGELCDICKDGFHQVMKNETHTECKACHKSCTALCTALGPKGCKQCKAGWLWDEEEGCEDIDECQSEEPPCADDEYCENGEGSYKCVKCDALCDQCLGPGKDKCIKCKAGNEMKEDGCTDIDECEQEDICKTEHMSCNNVPGSYYCDCSEGYERVGGECMSKDTLKANNESDEASGESAGDLESTTSQEGNNGAPPANGEIVSDNISPDDYSAGASGTDKTDSSSESHGGQDSGQEIPSSPADPKDVSEENDYLKSLEDLDDRVGESITRRQDIHTPGSHEEL